jgi:hypothetical protein
MALQPFVGPWPLFQFLDLFTQSVGLLWRGITPLQGRYLHTGQHKHRINTHRHTCLKWDSNPRSQCFEQGKTVNFLDRAAIVISKTNLNLRTPWSWVLLEKPTVSQRLKNFPVFYGNWRFITVFTKSHHRSYLEPDGSSPYNHILFPYHPS